ncbi:MAG: M23 family metallopeptidase [Schumannella sp.]
MRALPVLRGLLGLRALPALRAIPGLRALPGPSPRAGVRMVIALVLVLASLGTAAPPRPATPWLWPVPPPHSVSRAFVAPDSPYGAGHRGVDLQAAGGAPVRAPADGVVHFAGFVVDRPVLSIRHAGGVLSSFEPVEAVVAAGEPVRRGEVVSTLLAGTAPLRACTSGRESTGDMSIRCSSSGVFRARILLPVRRGSGAAVLGRAGIAGSPPRTHAASTRPLLRDQALRGQALRGQARGCAVA